nr:hypothetical protein [Candidatus Sigynarchaeota archaeon]
MRTHTNYGVNFEKDPPFKLTVQAVDQDDLQLFSHVIINIGDDEYVDDGYQVVFSSAIEYDLSEITISVDAVNQHQNVT